MICSNCGTEVKLGDKFCTTCGTAVEIADSDEKQRETKSMENLEKGIVKKEKSNKALKIAIPIILVCIVIGGILFSKFIANDREFNEAYSIAMSYMEDNDYDKALQYLRKAEKIKSKDPEVRESIDKIIDELFNECKDTVMDYIESCNYQSALDTLNNCPVTSNNASYDEYAKLKKVVSMRPSIESIDSTEFPNVIVTIAYEGESQLDEKYFSLSEAGENREIKMVEISENKAIITYVAKDVDYDSETLPVAIRINIEDVSLLAADSYDTPSFERASLQLVSTDVSDYPTIKAYFRVEDGDTYGSINNLSVDSFVIEERIEGGTYLSREIHNVSQLNGNTGLNISLVADKSDSISNEDMNKIKGVMSEFVDKLNYKEGDKAEVLAFDSIVQQMCAFTDNATLLVNGINNMSTDGMTAFYDAVYNGINHAALQGGARCVIAFTDGEDNSSRYDYADIINYANEQQVTLYIIGVGSVEEYTLRAMADETKGRYWYIDDLYDLEDIFNTIYAEQKQMYVLEYESDPKADEYDPRKIHVSMIGNGYKGECDTEFAPVKVVNAGEVHTSRYELFVEDVSWEEAAQKCQERGGHLVAITSEAEMAEVVRLVEKSEATYIWLGGYTSYDDYGDVFAHWITGEDFSYSKWSDGEPSRTDLDGTDEWYLMLWKVEKYNGWSWNDQRNDPAADFEWIQGKIGYVCEFE